MTKGFEAQINLVETPNKKKIADKPLKAEEIQNKRVDINVLKARAKAIQDKENAKSTVVIVLFLISLGVLGVYFST